MQSDATIRDDVLEELEYEPRIDAAGIGVSVHEGVVTLTGHVNSYMQKLSAEAAVKRVKGVKGLAQDLEVRLPFDGRHDDAEIAERASALLAWSVTAPKDNIEVKVEKGWIILRGEVNYAYQRVDAEQAVRKLAGVAGVTNMITIEHAVPPSDVKDRIKKAFHRNAELEAAGISVAAEGSKVILSGTVGTWGERRLAENAAWAAPGVSQVTDNIAVQ